VSFNALQYQDYSPSNQLLLVVDDEPAICSLLQQTFAHHGYQCLTANSGEEALDILSGQPVDVIFTDIRMPGIGGIELLKSVRQSFDADVIVMTGCIEDFSYETIIEIGARDFVHKPMSPKEALARLRRVLMERHSALDKKRTHDRLLSAHAELKLAYQDTINRLVLASEYKDEDTGDHILRMSQYCSLLAERYGLPPDVVQQIGFASPMHDVGKIGIPDKVLLNPGKLNNDELAIMKTHTEIGARLLANARSEILVVAAEIARTHHEKWDGSGYPNGLVGEQIPISGRITGLADVFDALTSSRPYKKPYPMDIVKKIICSESGRHFDPALVKVFKENIDDFILIREQVSEEDCLRAGDFTWSERDSHMQEYLLKNTSD